MVSYVPDRNDLIWLNFDPQPGREIQKKRSALVISPKTYNQKSGLALCMPIARKIKGYPFEVPISNKGVEGVILSDQLRSLDWRQRKAIFIAKADPNSLDESLQKFLTLVK